MFSYLIDEHRQCVLAQEEFIICGVLMCAWLSYWKTFIEERPDISSVFCFIGQQFSSGELSRLDSKEGEKAALRFKKGRYISSRGYEKLICGCLRNSCVRMGFEFEAENGSHWN